VTNNKNQHWIPQCYLKAWCDPDCPTEHTPYVWRFTKDGSASKKKAPENIFYEKDMYTIEKPDGTRDLVLENGLAQLEDQFARLREEKIRFRSWFTISEKVTLYAFIAAMHGRTKAQRDFQGKQWQGMRKQMEGMIEWAKKATPEEKRRLSSISPRDKKEGGITYEQVKAVTENPLQELLPLTIEVETKALYKMTDIMILETRESPGFITSDHPCVWFDPEGYKRPPVYSGPALMYDSIEISLPVSPKQIIVLNRRGHTGYYPAPPNIVADFNRRTRFRCQEYFVVQKNVKDPFWFNRGVEPEDSWNNQQKKRKTESKGSPEDEYAY
jgi:hypothetical protein